MRKYNLVLQGGFNIVINDADKQQIISLENAAIKNNQKDFVINLGDNRFKKSMIKGMFEIKDDGIIDYAKEWRAKNEQWSIECQAMSDLPAEDKTTIEIDNRILNIIRHDPNISFSEQEMAVLYSNILQFFKDNKKYPRCPRHVYWPFISRKIMNTKITRDSLYLKWWNVVDRNDAEIADWIKYH